jgi:hypothetical protein
MNEVNRKSKLAQPTVYQIRVKGHLEHRWSDWFDDLAITLQANGDTLLSGPVVDQSALYGLLKKVHDLGLPLISVNPVEICVSATQKERG